jgi:hypothetical protein
MFGKVDTSKIATIAFINTYALLARIASRLFSRCSYGVLLRSGSQAQEESVDYQHCYRES